MARSDHRPLLRATSLTTVATATLLAALLGGVVLTREAGASSTQRVAVNATEPVISSLAVGVVHTQYTAVPWNPSAAVSSAWSILRQGAPFQTVSLMGWGTGNPEPSPGVYDWSTLDDRIGIVRSTGGTPVICLCGAPDWMKGGLAGTTDWSKLDVAPLPSHYGDFANLAVAVARRYPEVRYFEVWNEFKGFYDPSTNAWNYRAYTQLYNAVADALLAYDPTLHVGGPYAPLDVWSDSSAGGHPSSLVGPWGTVDQRALDAIVYWLDNAHHPSFVVVDGGLKTRDGGAQPDPFGATAYFAAVNHWLRARTKLPIWWAEWYANPTTIGPAQSDEWTALYVASLLQLDVSGTTVATLWDPEQYSDSSTPGLWTSTTTSTGGQPTRLGQVFEFLTTYFRPGTSVALSAPAAGVTALAGGDHLIAVNGTASRQTILVGNTSVTLAPYEVATVAGAPLPSPTPTRTSKPYGGKPRPHSPGRKARRLRSAVRRHSGGARHLR
jgi:hypothetical protein